MLGLSRRPGWKGFFTWVNVSNRDGTCLWTAAVPRQEEGTALSAVSRHHKVPCGDAAISKMQIAHFLDFVSVDLDKGGEQGQTACTI